MVPGRCTVIVLLIVIGMLNGCATEGYRAFPDPALLTPSCDARIRQWQSRVARADAFEAQYAVVTGYPYLRVDRFLASVAAPTLSPRQRHEWLADSGRNGWQAWQLEAQMLGAGADELMPLQRCADEAIAILQRDADAFALMVAAVSVPDDYSTTAQVVGLSPLWSPIVQAQIARLFDALVAGFGQPLPAMTTVTYQPAAMAAPDDAALASVMVAAYQRSALGIPRFTAAERNRLFDTYAPTWTVETRDASDRPGTPVRRADGDLAFSESAVVYRHLSYTRAGDGVLPQLNYLMWFPRRPPTGAFDILAGELDGLFWRVTLGADGRPLWFDSVHSCGCYHLWFPVDGRTRLTVAARDRDAEVASPAVLPAGLRRAHLVVSAGDHYLIDVTSERRIRVNSRDYALADYDDLRHPTAPGVRLFGADGLVRGSERLERFLLWPMGVPSAGAMRQWGHHATAFLQRRHFDDPDLTRRVFVSEVP